MTEVIQIPPREGLLERALTTLPISPDFLYLELNYQGIYLPKKNNDEEYKRLCSTHRVIPHSRYEMRYNRKVKSFVFTQIHISPINLEDCCKEETRRRVASALKPGRVHKIKIQVNIPAEDGFNSFREYFFDLLQEEGYKVSKGELWLQYTNPKLPSRDSFLILDRKKGLELTIGNKTGKTKYKKLKSWYESLQSIKELV